MFSLCFFSSFFSFMGCVYGVVWCVCTHLWRPKVGIWSFLPSLCPLLFLTCNSLTSPGRPVSSRNPPGFASPAFDYRSASPRLAFYVGTGNWGQICMLPSQLLFSLHFPLLWKLDGMCMWGWEPGKETALPDSVKEGTRLVWKDSPLSSLFWGWKNLNFQWSLPCWCMTATQSASRQQRKQAEKSTPYSSATVVSEVVKDYLLIFPKKD